MLSMFDQIRDLYARDWNVLTTAALAWLHGGNPYASLAGDWSPGAFAYPPTTLPWLAIFAVLGGFSFYAWTGLQLYGWWRLARGTAPTQSILLCWAPLIINFLSGQTTFAVVLILWGAYQASERQWQSRNGINLAMLWGTALSLTSMKPQVALLPLLFLLWQNRRAPQMVHLWCGLVLGAIVTALPPTLANPLIWQQWLDGLQHYRRLNTLAGPWQEPMSLALVVIATVLWYRSHRGGWQWWLPAALLPQNAVYSMVLLMPAMRPRRNYWSLIGLTLAGILIAPVAPLTLSLILSGQLLAAWMITGGPERVAPESDAQ